ncbi:MAG: hypothetical protein GY774_20955 [Planctomycetes bacterium]|nr:hypothetical protein [Planctomycetota bacterium]
MKNIFQPLKTIIIGGAVFLVPLVIVVAVLGKAFQLMMVVTKALDKWIPADSIGGIALLGGIPGYTFIKGFTDSMVSSDKFAEDFIPVIARFDDNAQLGFEVDRTEHGNVAVYLPGAPNPWSGSVVYVREDQVDRLNITVSEAIKNIRQLGRGSAQHSERILGTTQRSP